VKAADAAAAQCVCRPGTRECAGTCVVTDYDTRHCGACNAPGTDSWVYRDFWDQPKPGYRLYRQPGGRDPGAENIENLGPDYYHNLARLNAHRPWWVRLMVDNKPGFTRDGDLVYPGYDDDRNIAGFDLKPAPELPVLVGVDGGLTPAAVYAQEMPDGQFVILDEIALDRGDENALAAAMLALEARRYRNCDFATVCDPAMKAGEDTESGSMRTRLAAKLGRDEPGRVAIDWGVYGAPETFLVGADGIHSRVRTALFGEEYPRFTGVVSFRSVVPTERVKNVPEIARNIAVTM
jgi:hypothetical protein